MEQVKYVFDLEPGREEAFVYYVLTAAADPNLIYGGV